MNKKILNQWLQTYCGWVIISCLVLVPVVRWLLLHDIRYIAESPSSFFATFGKLTGLVGLLLYAINLVLATRTHWIENLFNGLNKVYIAHHLTGGIALILLVFHPLFLAFRYIDVQLLSSFRVAAEFLLPRTTFGSSYDLVDIQQAAAINAGMIAFVGMVVLLILTFFVKLPYRFWLATHKFLGVAFMFAGLHVILINSDTSRDTFLRFYMLAWVIIGLSAFVYRTLLNNIFIRRYPYKVVAVTQEKDNVVGIALEPLDKKMSHKPGQFVFLRFLELQNKAIRTESHPFSIASSPQNNTLQIYVKSLGDFTSSLKHLNVGSIAEIEGAYGKFTYTRFENTPQIWIAGGIGVTPFLSMAHSYTSKSPKVDMIYCVVNRSELLDQNVLNKLLPKKYKRFRYFSYVSKEQNGYITGKKIKEMCGSLEGKQIFICGPTSMMKDLRAQLRSLGVPNHNIHTEEFSMS